MKTLAIFGATGQTGLHLVAQALLKGGVISDGIFNFKNEPTFYFSLKSDLVYFFEDGNKFKMSKFKISKFKISKFKMSKFKTPKFKISKSKISRLNISKLKIPSEIIQPLKVTM